MRHYQPGGYNIIVERVEAAVNVAEAVEFGSPPFLTTQAAATVDEMWGQSSHNDAGAVAAAT